MEYPEYRNDVDLARAIHKKYGKSFYFGTFLLTKKHHDATCILYAFFRYPDEYVDTVYVKESQTAREKLNIWKNEWKAIYGGEKSTLEGESEQILRATKYVFDAYDIPFELSTHFLEAMSMDTWKREYATYEDLKKYMYGSAGVVGIIMTYIFCNDDVRFKGSEEYRAKVLDRAEALGEAFQMTNFLRDIGDDIASRGRIYIPQEDMNMYNVSRQDLIDRKMTKNIRELLAFEIKRTHALYILADEGIQLLPPTAGKAVYIARVLYSQILRVLESEAFDIFRKRAHLTFIQKAYIALPIVLRT